MIATALHYALHTVALPAGYALASYPVTQRGAVGLSLAANGAIAVLARRGPGDGDRVVVWRADGSRVVIGLPREAALRQRFKHVNIYQPPFPMLSFRRVVLAADGTPFASVNSTFSGAYLGNERAIYRWTGARWKLSPTGHAASQNNDDVVAVDLASSRIALTVDYDDEPYNTDLAHSDPLYLAPEAYVTHGDRAVRLGFGALNACSGPYAAGYLATVDWKAHHGTIPERRPTALVWHAGRRRQLGIGIAFGVNDHGVAVGDDRSSEDDQARTALPMRWDGRGGAPLAHRYGTAYAIAPDGTIVGTLRRGGGFVYRNGRLTLLDQIVPGVHVVGAYAINAQGRILVAIGTEDAPRPAYLDPVPLSR